MTELEKLENQPTNEQRSLLKRYLDQYHYARRKKRVLEERLTAIRDDLKHPSISASIGGMPSAGNVSNGAASLVFKEAEIVDRIRRQTEIAATVIIDVMDMLEFLPADSTEKMILELRHIDCKGWDEITQVVHLTRTPCFEHYRKGLDKLLSFKKVTQILEDFERRQMLAEKDGY